MKRSANASPKKNTSFISVMSHFHSISVADSFQLQEYEVFESLSKCTDSMLFDSNTVIASLSAKKGSKTICLDLMVRGDVSVDYEGKTYRKPTDFPEELKTFIAEHPNEWERMAMVKMPEDLTNEQYERLLQLLAEGLDIDMFEERQFCVNMNNWFEYIYTLTDCTGEKSDGILFEEDLSSFTEEKLKADMTKLAEELLDR